MGMISFLRPKTLAATLGFAVFMPMAAQALSIDLDFGEFSQESFGTGSDLQVQMSDVATGINATLTAANAFPTSNGANGKDGDLSVNLMRGNSIDLTLTLWDATVGTGYEAAYDPGTSFSWDLVFYDLDGVVGKTTDNLTLYSPSTYTVTTTTALTIETTVDGAVKFIGGGASNVPNAIDPETGFTQEQADVAVVVGVDNLNTLFFNYEATGRRTNRNLLVDGGTLTLDDFATETQTVVPSAVPVPLSGSLLFGAIAMMGGIAFKRRKQASL